jgi:hypothetical protein
MVRIDGGWSRWLFLKNAVWDQQDLPPEFFAQIQEDPRSLIGMNYYYIRMRNDCPILCRMPAGADTVKKEEVLNHTLHGISDDDLIEEVKKSHIPNGNGQKEYYQLSPRIEHKLRVLLEIE